MMAYEWILLSPAILGIGAMLVLRLLDSIEDRYYADGGHQRRYNAFMTDARKRGLGYHEAMDELAVREAFARLRRIASNRVATGDIEDWLTTIETTAKEVADRLGKRKPELVKPFRDMVAASVYTDILYPAEAALVHAHCAAEMKAWKKTRLGKDEFAALKIV